MIERAFQLYDIEVVFVAPIRNLSSPIQVNLRDSDVAATGRVLEVMAHCFFVPVNTHLILAVQDDKENRLKYEPVVTETIEIPNLLANDEQEKSEIAAIITGVFGLKGATLRGNTVILHATKKEIVQVVDTLTQLFQPAPQVLLEVNAYILSRGHNRNLGLQLPQQVTVFNIDTAAQSLISSNSSVVQALIAAGDVSSGDTLGIAEALIAGGYGGSSVLSSPFGFFGGGITSSGLQFDSSSLNTDLSVSNSQQLQSVMLHLADNQLGTLKLGQRYPIMTASTVVVGATTSNGAPSIEYEDLGLILEMRPHIGSDGEVLLHVHETFRSLDGTSLNSIPILDNQEFVSDLSVPNGVTTVIVSNLSVSETRTVQGLATSIPTNGIRNLQSSDLVVTITPMLSRSARPPSR
ncbi:type II secretion system protein GspD [Granulicella sp. L60]|uniref:type II secretion system protein GspD n=1 Tax=Granulicella sp. L60 TaxID=1641866 RepID=UPI00131D9BE2|nr:hypothetical protein [Granulicella sp. L60]